MELVAAVAMVAATLGLLALFAAGANGYRLPPSLFTPRTWLRAAVMTLGFGLAAALGMTLAGGGALSSVVLGASAAALWLEFHLWAEAKAFGPRDGA